MRKISLSNETNLDIKQKLARVFDDNLKRVLADLEVSDVRRDAELQVRARGDM